MADQPNPKEQHNDESVAANSKKDLLTDMYEDYFLDYASYVILERAVPAVNDGLKPVQRRILHAMRSMHDGRYHKVANIIGQTMQYHPHGDAAIGDALVHVGQKDLLIDCQGNWGDTRTGDRSAAPRYIEARLSPFALAISFNDQTTNFQLSYDGRKKEPITLPMKFPLLLAQGVEGIAVGLSTRIMPHNFIELIEGSMKILKGKKVDLMPDFPTGGLADCSNYNGGKRGGRIRIRAKIEQRDKRTLAITELPFGTTTESLINSILKANDKGKIKIKRVVDNTAQEVEILVFLPNNASPDMTMDALYAVTDCEVSISPNACVIVEEKPVFITVNELLEYSTEHTKNLLEWELKNKLAELEEKWHFASLEKIFIENRIYRDIESCETWEEVVQTIHKGLKPYVKHLQRAVTDEDVQRLTEIKIKRISKYNTFKAEERIRELEEQLEEVRHHVAHLTDYAIAYFKDLLDRFSKGRERKTVLQNFGTIKAQRVVVKNEKLYLNRKEGFMGYGLKKDEYIQDCSDIDLVIVFNRDGSYFVTEVSEKAFIGKYPLHVAVWKKGNERMIYNAIYTDLEAGRTYAKRFAVQATTRDRVYPIARKMEKVKVHYFSANPNGQAEKVGVQLTQACSAKKKNLDYDFAELDVKGRGAKGNLVTKYPVRRVKLEEKGESTLGARKIWIDKATGRLNNTEHGALLGAFESGEEILALHKDGSYEVTDFALTNRYEPTTLLHIEKLDPEAVITAVYYDGERQATYVKRFQIETSTQGQRFEFLPNEHRSTKLLLVTTQEEALQASYKMRVKSKTESGEVDLADLGEVMGWKAIGNKLSDYKLREVELLKTVAKAVEPGEDEEDTEEGQKKMF